MNGSLTSNGYTVLTQFRFGVAEQAINAIYFLAAQPDVLCGEIVKAKTKAVFRREARTQEAQESRNTEATVALSSARGLSQLLFIVGHIASKSECCCANMSVKQLIHIELCEAEFKRRKLEIEKGNSST